MLPSFDNVWLRFRQGCIYLAWYSVGAYAFEDLNREIITQKARVLAVQPRTLLVFRQAYWAVPINER